MNHAPQHLAQADRHIVDLKAHIGRQRILVNHARDTGQPSRMAESLLDALEGSLRIFEKHRELIVAQLQRQPAKWAAQPKMDDEASGNGGSLLSIRSSRSTFESSGASATK
jgi:hypothetical protein